MGKQTGRGGTGKTTPKNRSPGGRNGDRNRNGRRGEATRPKHKQANWVPVGSGSPSSGSDNGNIPRHVSSLPGRSMSTTSTDSDQPRSGRTPPPQPPASGWLCHLASGCRGTCVPVADPCKHEGCCGNQRTECRLQVKSKSGQRGQKQSRRAPTTQDLLASALKEEDTKRKASWDALREVENAITDLERDLAFAKKNPELMVKPDHVIIDIGGDKVAAVTAPASTEPPAPPVVIEMPTTPNHVLTLKGRKIQVSSLRLMADRLQFIVWTLSALFWALITCGLVYLAAAYDSFWSFTVVGSILLTAYLGYQAYRNSLQLVHWETITFGELVPKASVDERSALLSLSELKHKDPLICKIRHSMPLVKNGRYSGRAETDMWVSLELLSHVLSAPVEMPNATVESTWLRINTSLKGLQIVNDSRYDVLKFQQGPDLVKAPWVRQHTAIIAERLCEAERERTKNVPFPKPH